MNYKLEKAIEYFLSSPKMLEYSSGKFLKGIYGKKFFDGETKEFIYKAKEEARKRLHEKETEKLKKKISEKDKEIARLVSSKESPVDEFGIRSVDKVFESRRILTDNEIRELAQIDNITCKLGTVWKKLQVSGIWTYSIRVDYITTNFYDKDQLKIRLKELFPDNITPFKLPEVKVNFQDWGVFVYIADDHAGLKFTKSLFGNEYSKDIYEKRMMIIADRIMKMSGVEKIFIVRLGDEVDGYNAKTTREGHSLESLSNKEQFDIFTSVNKKFYDTIFSSGIAKEYEIINCNNSNHSGLGFSYILNSAVEMYLDGKYPEVKIRHVNDFIDVIEWGKHVIGVTHGKDEKYMKRGFPLNITPEVDLWLKQYYEKKGYVTTTHWISTIKGDLHKYNVNIGKSGRYVNCPSIAGSSYWSEHNFGDSEAGALIEWVNKTDKDISNWPVNF